jgi:hypothetical protein
MGKPIDVTKTEGPPTPEQLDIVHNKYIGMCLVPYVVIPSAITDIYVMNSQ